MHLNARVIIAAFVFVAFPGSILPNTSAAEGLIPQSTAVALSTTDSNTEPAVDSATAIQDHNPNDTQNLPPHFAIGRDGLHGVGPDNPPGNWSNSADNLWDRIRTGFAFNEMDTPLVKNNEIWYENHPDYVSRMLDRSKLYLYYIVQQVEKRGMPTEIALLPMVESAFNPKAYSKSHAAGIWQFIPSTGKNFGLKQNWWYDERLDIMAATNAALDYLQKLHDMFGSWELALAAYNWGEGAVSRAVARNEAKGKSTEYTQLRMPNETRNYVPRLIALKHIIMNPQVYDLTLNDIPNRPYFTKVVTKDHMDLAVAARLAEMPLDEFVSLNPAHHRPVIKPSSQTVLLLPVDKVEPFSENLENYDKPLVSWQAYSAKRGERLDKIAIKYGLSVSRLKEINGIKSRGLRLARSQTLLVPSQGENNISSIQQASFSDITTVDNTEPSGIHRVRHGDTLFAISRQYGVSIPQIKSWNHLKSNHLSLNQKLVIYSSKSRSNEKVAKAGHHTGHSKSKTRYTVRHGDTLSSIAHHFNVAVNDIERWNNFSSKHTLKPGEKVTILLASNG